MRFIVIGAGAVGGVVGGRLLQHGHPVVFVARGAHGAALAERGLTVVDPDGQEAMEVEVRSSPALLDTEDGDVALLAVKSQDTDVALDQLAVAPGPAPPVVCLQNGVHNEREALRRFGRVYAATVMCPTVHLEPGEVRAHSSPTTGIIDVGRYPAGVDATVTAVIEALASSTFSSEPRDDILRWKWAKLVTNLGNAIEAVCRPPARGSTTIETDYLNGEIVMLGHLHGVPTPVNRALTVHARRMVASGAAPGSVDEQVILGST